MPRGRPKKIIDAVAKVVDTAIVDATPVRPAPVVVEKPVAKKGSVFPIEVVCASGPLTLRFATEAARERSRKYIRARVSRGLVAEDVTTMDGIYDLLDVCYLRVAV